jgi:hypothetical protein
VTSRSPPAHPGAPSPSAPPDAVAAPPAPLAAVLAVTFLGSTSGGAFWTGAFFVTARHYGFSPGRNLALATLMGACYALAALRAGALVERVAHRLSRRTVLAASLAVWALAALAPVLFASEAAVWAAASVGVGASAVVWPVVESYLGAGRHGAALRAALGWFNATWTAAVAVPLLTLPLLALRDVRLTIAASAASNALALAVALLALPREPGAHQPEEARLAAGAEYPALLRSSWWLLPLSYVLMSTLTPVLPFRLAAIGVPAAAASVVAATWMVSRFAALALMGRLGFWHGRWATPAVAALALVGGLAGVLLAGTVPVLLCGLVVFGVGLGVIYGATLYYALVVGEAAVDAGGTFEGLIGVGYTLGPLLGLAGIGLAELSGGGEAHAARATVALTWLAVATASVPAVRPWLEARRSRRRRPP